MRPMKALEKARDAFERWNLAMALPVMAAVVLYLGRPEDIEFDALLVLRYDIRHQYAAANTAGITNLRFRGRTARRRDGSNELG